MRKLLNKKGFSIMELVIVVAIMGIILMIAIPSYRNSKTKAENKGCATNIEILKLAVVEYYASYQTYPDSMDDLLPFLDEDGIPVCTKSNGSTVYNYGIAAKKNANNTWSGIVVCGCDDAEHTPNGEDTSFPTGSIEGECYVLQEPSTVKK
jgi:prepilin-type N-terminal cleavage/methylation domain-containing protein